MSGELTDLFFTADGGLVVYTVDHQAATARFYLIGSDHQIANVLPAPYGQIGDLVAYNP
jgi:hypothetical protein